MNQSEDQAGFESLVSRHLNAMLRVAAALVGVAEMVAGQSSDGTPLVYLDLGDAFNGFSPSAETVQVYGTSERALLPAPTQGFPARQNPGRPVGVLSDGSVLFATAGGLYSWKAGDVSWQMRAAKVDGPIAYAFLAPAGTNGKQPLIVVMTDNTVARFEV
jgi:hypothetical protein